MNIIIEIFGKRKHSRENFDCGNTFLNNFIKTKLSQEVAKYLSTGYVVLNQERDIMGFFTLCQHSLKNDNSITNNKGNHKTIPATLLGIFALDIKFQKQGIGTKVMYEIFKLHINAIEKIASSAIIVNPLPEVKKFYRKCFFEELPRDNELTMYITTKNIKLIIKELKK